MQHTSGQGSFETFLGPKQKLNNSVVTVYTQSWTDSAGRAYIKKRLAWHLKYNQPYWGS